MGYVAIAGVLLLAFTNGANDNFKGVATLWGTGRYAYCTTLLWATLATFAGASTAGLLAGGLVNVFNGSQFLGQAIDAASSSDALGLALGGCSLGSMHCRRRDAYLPNRARRDRAHAARFLGPL